MVSPLRAIIFTLIFVLSFSPPVLGTVIDFEGYDSGTVIDDEYLDLGVAFNPGGVISFMGPDKILSVNPEIIAIFQDGINVNNVSVDYISAVPLTLEAYDSSDMVIASETTSAGNGTFGLITDRMIRKVVIHDNGFDFSIDNFSFSVPESSTGTLLISCLIGLCYLKRKAY